VTDPDAATVTGDLSLSCNSWQFAGRVFEVNSFHYGEHDCWSYELYEVNTADPANDYLDIRVPDRQPADGPFTSAGAEHATLTVHGSWTVPWPVLCHLLTAVEASVEIGP
jgi:hypothetical protein